MALALRPGYRALLQAFGTTVAFGMLLQPAIAEEQVQKIQVTGSAIKRIASEGALPVQSISASEIKKTGATNVAELLQNLPAMQGFTNAAANVGSGNVGYSSASLHNLGDSRTLVLLNGKRLATFAGQTFIGGSSGVNLNSIPIAAVERVEVLTDGASAIYGTDAVAGVVNFILKSNYQGLDASISYNAPEAGGAEEKRISVSGGFGDIEQDRFNVLLTYSHTENDPLAAADRKKFAVPPSQGYYNFTGTDGQIYRLRPSSGRGNPANATITWYNASAAPDDQYIVQSFNPSVMAGNPCPAKHVRSGNTCRYIYPYDLEIYPEQKQDAFTGSVQFKLSENHTLFADMLYSKHTMTSNIAPPPGEVPLTVGDSLWTTYIQPYLRTVPAGYDIVDAVAPWRISDAGPRRTKGTTEAIHFSGGSKGVIAGWDYSAAFTHSENKWQEELLSGYLYNDDLNALISSGALNPFGPAGSNTAALQSALASGVWKKGTAVLDAVELRGSKEIAQLPAGGLMFGAGLDWKREADKYEPNGLAQGTLRGGQFPDFATDVPFDVSRDSYGLFGELIAPVVKNLEVSGALRYDNYSDVGGTTNYKVGARWQALNNLLFRTSFNTGFRAPRPAQTQNITQLYGVTANPYDCPYTDARAVYCKPPGTQYPLYTGGSSELKPEESKQFSFGVRFEPTSWSSVGADYWNVSIKNTFGTISEEEVAADFEGAWGTSVRSDLYTDPQTGKPILAWYTPLKNLGERKAQGVDYDVTLGSRYSFGRILSSFKGTWMLSDKQQTEIGGEYYQIVGIYSNILRQVALRHQFQWANTLSMADWDHRLTMNYKHGYYESRDGAVTGDVILPTGCDTPDSPFCKATYKVKEYVTFDWQTTYRTPVKGLDVTGGILNIFDANPPFSLNAGTGQAVGYNPQVADPRGRTYYLQAGYKFK
ncbi:TonB-dependent receptor domain-containing protein [Niveibacterium sp. COAC-50]|uniref:TonB-dependent receptor domain-containing protein n=1 Tax=Niveibacterium sp. COAC-50 TaxID=2729384 RepID=UPI001553BC7D|nr:TonB-dependent receptor [Niveibacterium sp. COAC-50]